MSQDPSRTSFQALESKEEAQAQEETQFHPLIPTIDQAKRNPDGIYSDHVAQLVQFDKGPRVIFGNTLNPTMLSGFQPDPESSEASSKRALRIIKSINMMQHNQNADAIATVESGWLTKEENETLRKLTKTLKWNIEYDQESACLSAKKCIKRFSTEDLNKFVPAAKGNLGSLPPLLVLEYEEYFFVTVRFEHSEFPDKHETFLKKFLAELSKAGDHPKPVHMIADMNVRVLSEARVRDGEFGVTSAVPAIFRRSDQHPNGFQGADYTHLFLTYTPDNKKFEQVPSSILNPTTGNVFVLKNKDRPKLAELQEAEVTEFRPAMTLGTSYANGEIIHKYSIEKYKEFLKDYFGEKVSAHISVNGCSQLGFTLTIRDEDIFANLDKKLPDSVGFRMPEELGCSLRQFSVPLEQAVWLHKQLMSTYTNDHGEQRPQNKSFFGGFRLFEKQPLSPIATLRNLQDEYRKSSLEKSDDKKIKALEGYAQKGGFLGTYGMWALAEYQFLQAIASQRADKNLQEITCPFVTAVTLANTTYCQLLPTGEGNMLYEQMQKTTQAVVFLLKNPFNNIDEILTPFIRRAYQAMEQLGKAQKESPPPAAFAAAAR
jgi:hypothetical protein